jgi:hypothetical protein
MVQCGLDDSIVIDIHGLLEKAAIDSIIEAEIVLDVRIYVERPTKARRVLLTAYIILSQPTANPSGDKIVEQTHQPLEQKRIGRTFYLLGPEIC